VARIVGVQRDDSVEPTLRQFTLEDHHLGLRRFAPELAIQILAAARFARAVLVAGRVAKRIDVEMKGAAEKRVVLHEAQKIDQRVNSRWLVAVYSREDGELQRRLIVRRPAKEQSRHPVPIITHVPESR